MSLISPELSATPRELIRDRGPGQPMARCNKGLVATSLRLPQNHFRDGENQLQPLPSPLHPASNPTPNTQLAL